SASSPQASPTASTSRSSRSASSPRSAPPCASGASAPPPPRAASPFFPSGARRAEGRADLLERLALGVDTEEGGDERGAAHEGGGEGVGAGERGAAAALDHRAEERRPGEAAERGAEGVEDRDRDGAHLERKHFAHGEVGGAGGSGGDEEDRAPAQGERGRAQGAGGERFAGREERDAGQRVGERDHDAPPDGVEEP